MTRTLDLQLPDGRLRAEVSGPEDDPHPVVCVPGLSANLRGFDALVPALARAGRRVVALDLRGRGHSETTPPGTYGWPAHARDVLAAAERLGATRVDIVGHSMGAFVAMQAAADTPERVGRLVLIDGAGTPEPSALPPIERGLGRLERWHPSADAYVEAIRAAGVVRPWGPLWDAFYRYELDAGEDGRVRPRTSLAAVTEDARYGGAHRQDALWPALRGPVLVVRGTVPLGDDGTGFVLSAADAARFVATVPGAALVEVDANHFGVVADARSVAAIVEFLTA